MSDELVTQSDLGTPAPSSQAPAPQPSTGFQQPPAASTQAPTAPAPEDRSNWIPPYRFKEGQEAAYRRAQSEFAQQQQGWQSEKQKMEAQIRSLVGVGPQENPEVEQIRQQFLSIFPEYKDIRDMVDDLKAMRANQGNLEFLEKQYWNSHGQSSVDRLFKQVEDAIGTPLTPEGKQFLHTSFVGYVQSSPQNTERYSTDPRFVDDFVRQFTSSIVDPARRQSTAAVAGRIPSGLPQDRPSGAPQMGAAPQPQNLDERSAMAWAAFNAAKNAQ